MLAYHRLLSVSSLSLIILLYCVYSSDETLPSHALKLNRTNRKHKAQGVQEPRTYITGINTSCAKGKNQSVTDQIILIPSRLLLTQVRYSFALEDFYSLHTNWRTSITTAALPRVPMIGYIPFESFLQNQ